LVFVPLLTPDVQGSNEGRIPHDWFPCQDFIRPFLSSLLKEPRSLMRIAGLGTIQPQTFKVTVFGSERLILGGGGRREYWSDFDPTKMQNAVLFFDPDNGYETKTCAGKKWIRHGELEDLIARLPETSVVVVYQHRPRRMWASLFADLARRLDYVHTAVAAHEANLAFVAMAGNAVSGHRVNSALVAYANSNPAVKVTSLRNSRSVGEKDWLP
jgi:hypothetical protein